MDLSALSIISFLGIGVAAGATAGLIGVGGGIVTVPFLYWMLTGSGTDSQTAFNIARGTSLAIMILTSASSAFGHRKLNHVDASLAARLSISGAPGVLVGSALGAMLNVTIPRTVFGCVSILVAAYFFLRKDIGDDESEPEPARARIWIWVLGFFVGGFSGFLGIGGGTVAIPVMTLLLGMRAHRAVGTSAALVVPISVLGAACYVALGWGKMPAASHMAGYVSGPALFAISATSVIAANVFAKLTGRISAVWVRRLFGIYMAATGLKMVSELL